MTQEEKDLLLKDLCGRIMYGVKCTVYEDTNVHTLSGVIHNNVYNELYFRELDWKECDGFADIQYCKPYLFPLSSMTDEQYDQLYIDSRVKNDSVDILDALANDMDAIYWLLKNHFDIYDLIPMGLANDATGLNIY